MLLTIRDLAVLMISKTAVIPRLRGTQKKEFTTHYVHLMHNTVTLVLIIKPEVNLLDMEE